MTTPTPTPEKQNSPDSGDSEETTPAGTGFFHRVRRELNPPEPIHPSEEAEIVIMKEDADGDR